MPEGLSGERIAAKSEWKYQVRGSLAAPGQYVEDNEPAMGILTRKQGDLFVISSDHIVPGVVKTRPPRRLDEPYHVWTGSMWSSTITEAALFGSLDEADEYVRANYTKLSVIT
jgi:hypothetical protein